MKLSDVTFYERNGGIKMESIVGKIAKGYSDTCQKYVEGKIYYHYSNGIGILTDGGIVFVENGKYEIIDA